MFNAFFMMSLLVVAVVLVAVGVHQDVRQRTANHLKWQGLVGVENLEPKPGESSQWAWCLVLASLASLCLLLM